MLNLFAKLLAQLSLPTIHFFGVGLGWIIHFFTPTSGKIQRANLLQAGFLHGNVIAQNIAESGKSVLETLAIWQKGEPEILSLVKQVNGWDVIENALRMGKGIIFLTPHLGCFEITSICYGSRYPVTVLFRPPKLKWLQSLMNKGRSRTGVSLAEANASGVRKLMQALKRGEAIGILPDQIPKAGEGEWADFFGKPAYTMTLASKLAEKTGAIVLMAFGERLANGEGFLVHFKAAGNIVTPALMNKAIENQIAQAPSQYLWRYDRYKQRRHAQEKFEKQLEASENTQASE